MSVVELCVGVPAFWAEDAAALRAQHAAVTTVDGDTQQKQKQQQQQQSQQREQAVDLNEKGVNENNTSSLGTSPTLTSPPLNDKIPSMRQILFYRPWAYLAWLLGFFLFFNIAVEFGLGGWTTTYTRVIRHASAFDAGLSSTLYWTGLTVGRLTLGILIGKIGYKRSLTIFVPMIFVFQFVSWFAPGGWQVMAATVFIQGLFVGPCFPAYIMLVSSQVPKKLHIHFMSLTCMFGRLGGGIFPYIVGPAADHSGVWVVQPFMVAAEVGMIIAWILIPKTKAGSLVDNKNWPWWRRMLFRVW